MPHIPKTTELGNAAEQIALEYLITQGCQIHTRNYRAGRGEIDIIAEQAGLLIFVEVRYRRSQAFGYPEATLSAAKRQLLLRTAEAYITEINWQGNIRFDVVALQSLDISEDKAILWLQDAIF